MLFTGYSRLDITPPLGIGLNGYFHYRFSDGVLDPLYANALAVSDGNGRAVIISVDIVGIPLLIVKEAVRRISERCRIPENAVIVACTHIHTGPSIVGGDSDSTYNEILLRKLGDAAFMALSALLQTTVSVSHSEARNVSFIRRFRMKDGTVRTNPGIDNPDVAGKLGEEDNEVQSVLLTRTGGRNLLLVHFQVHPDVIGGNKYSADFPGFVRKTVESVLPDTDCIYFNGAQGDTNHINPNPPEGRPWGGYEHAKSMGRAIALSALASLDKSKQASDAPVRFSRIDTPVPVRRFSASEISEAEAVCANSQAGNVRSSSMEELGRVACARKILKYSKFAFIELPIFAIAFSDVLFVSMPGEPFTEIGRQIKNSFGSFIATLPLCCANGYQGYLPTRDAFEGDGGGYEALSCVFEPGVAEKLIESGIKLKSKLS
ncbi:MAG: hypothetical protein VB118_06740 [Oscillospiraceae bacterium]|nr:hypothetical protein [Oscillospiraceae bacterium]